MGESGREPTDGAAQSKEPGARRMRGVLAKIGTRLKFMFYAVAGADNEPDMYRFEQEPRNEAIFERLNNRATALVGERAGLRIWRTLIVFGSGAIPVIFLLAVPEWDNGTIERLSGWDWKLGACLVFLEFFLLISLLFVRARVASLGAQLVILEYEKVLISIEQVHEKRAADLFFKHQAELKQYYDQTLRQNRQSFIVGIFCIGFGLAAVIVVATLLLDSGESTTAARLAAGGLGILSVLLTGFVARIYLRVYEGSAEALGSFHERLVNTNDYHFASLLISMIEPKRKRMASQSALASAISSPRIATETED
jgi:hypothetical protein